MEYKPRLIDKQIKTYLDSFGAVVIEGMKWCGKTWTAKHHAKSTFELADPAGNFRNRELARLEPLTVLHGNHPRLIDEWQEVPPLWDAVRHTIDQHAYRGAFILTGSSTPNDGHTIHSGAGRFGRLLMSTMSLYEMGISSGALSLTDLMNETSDFRPMAGSLSLEQLAETIIRGGWPGLQDASLEVATRSAKSYLDTIATIDLSRIDDVKRDPNKVANLLRSLARNTASYVSIETIRQDIAGFSENITAQTIGEYLTMLERIFVYREIPSWEPPLKSATRLRQSPKRLLAEPSLAVAALGADKTALLDDMKLLGNLFETLVLHDLQIYAQAGEFRLFQYHDNADLEVDAIIEARSGDYGAIEIKLGYYHTEEAAANLLRFRDKMKSAGQKAPRFMAVITGVGGTLRQLDNGVISIPIDHLTA